MADLALELHRLRINFSKVFSLLRRTTLTLHTQQAHALHQQALELLLIAYDELWALVMACADRVMRQLQRGVGGELAERRYSSLHSCNNTSNTYIRRTRSMRGTKSCSGMYFMYWRRVCGVQLIMRGYRHLRGLAEWLRLPVTPGDDNTACAAFQPSHQASG